MTSSYQSKYSYSKSLRIKQQNLKPGPALSSVKKLLPKLGSEDFRSLDFKTQLYIVSLSLNDKDKYKELCGDLTADEEAQYLSTSLEKMLSLPTAMNTSQDLPISFSENCWCAYLSYYNSKWWDDGASPLDEVGLDHKRFFHINLFNFPLLGLNDEATKILNWIMSRPNKISKDSFFYLVKMLAAKMYFSAEPDSEQQELDLTDIWNLSVTRLNQYATVRDINNDFPVIEDNERVIDLVEDETLCMLSSYKRNFKKIRFVPLVPSELYTKSQFYIKGWDFLTK